MQFLSKNVRLSTVLTCQVIWQGRETKEEMCETHENKLEKNVEVGLTNMDI